MLAFRNIMRKGFVRSYNPIKTILRPSFSKMFNQTFILFFGCPGAGKGTFSRLYSNDTGIPILAMGDEIRKIISRKVEYSGNIEKINKTITKGNFLGDDISRNPFFLNVNLFLVMEIL